MSGRRSKRPQVVMPIGQAMICDLVPEHERGTAFGIMKSVCSVLCLGKSMGKSMGKGPMTWPSQPWDLYGTWMMDDGKLDFFFGGGNRMDRIQLVHVGHVRWTWKMYYIEKSMGDTGSRSGKRKFGWTGVCKKKWTKWMNFLFDANWSSFLGWVSVLAEIAWIPWGT